MASSTTTTAGSSVSAFLSTLIPALIVFVIFMLIFIICKNKFDRVYQPRAVVDTVPDMIKVDKQPKGVFGWFGHVLGLPVPELIREVGVDGYFFLRYLRNFITIGLGVGIILWAVLIPINATGGGGSNGFDSISYSNNTHKNRVYAYVFCSWFFFGVIIYMIYHELVFYTSFRHALQTTPFYSSLPQSRTLLIDNVPEKLLNEESIRELFPASQQIWIPEKTKELQKLVKKRTKLASKFEGGLTKLVTKSTKLRNKAQKKGEELPSPADDPSAYFKDKKLPTYKDKPIIGKKKYLLTDGYTEMEEYDTQIKELQASYPGHEEKEGAVLILFASHLELQRAYQAVPFSDDLKKSRRRAGFAPEDVIWSNMGASFYSRMVKKAGAVALLTATIIFWSIPVAVVGVISNINYLIEKLPWLGFINNMPSKLLGIITGLLPTVALAVLMSLLPPFIRKVGKISGCLTVQEVERWTQQWYYAFQVVQTFLVTTLASAASSSVTAILDDPSSAMKLLSKYLPPAANFYICYIELKGLSISSGSLAQIVPLILSFILGPLLDKTPRKKWNRYNKLGTMSWGTTYGDYGFFTVIIMCYGIIAPIIILFVVVAYFLVYVSFLYNLTYVKDHAYDSRGRNYPLALFEVFVGMYVAEICLCGLFVMQKNWACVALEIVWIVVTIISHVYFRWTFEPVLDTVPMGAIRELEAGETGAYSLSDQGKKQIKAEGEAFFVNGRGTTAGFAEDGPFADDNSSFTFKNNSPQVNEKAKDFTQQGTSAAAKAEATVPADTEKSAAGQTADPLAAVTSPASVSQQITDYFRPKSVLTLEYMQTMIPSVWKERCSKALADDVDYSQPAISDASPDIWIPKDEMGMSTKLIEKTEGKFHITDENAIVDEKAKAQYTGLPPDYTEELAW